MGIGNFVPVLKQDGVRESSPHRAWEACRGRLIGNGREISIHCNLEVINEFVRGINEELGLSDLGREDVEQLWGFIEKARPPHCSHPIRRIQVQLRANSDS